MLRPGECQTPSYTSGLVRSVSLNPVPIVVPMLNPCNLGVLSLSVPESKLNLKSMAV